MKIRITNDARYNPDDRTPTYGTEGAAAVDIRISECIRVKPGEVRAGKTGLRVEFPTGVAGLILPRSGLGSKGIILANTVGLIDSDYRGEIILMFRNCNTSGKPFHIEEGSRVAQMIFFSPLRVELELVESLNETARGAGGFGSTGVK